MEGFKKFGFREWLDKQERIAQEACTDTGDIAGFARVIGSNEEEKDEDKKKKQKKQKK